MYNMVRGPAAAGLFPPDCTENAIVIPNVKLCAVISRITYPRTR